MKRLIIIVVVILLLAGGVYYFFWGRNGNNSALTSEERQSLEDIINATSTVPGEAKPIIKQIDYLPYKGQDIAEVGDDPIMGKFPEAVVKQYREELERLKGVLIKDPTDTAAWIKVGLLKKIFNNYIGARDAWEYAVEEFVPNEATTLAGLADLYGFYLKDFEQAEEYFRRAITADKNQTSVYVNAADFYRNVYTEKKGEAEKIILEGLNSLPNDESLLIYLASYYRDEGNKEKAVEYYEKVLAIEPGNEAVREEIGRLSQ